MNSTLEYLEAIKNMTSKMKAPSIEGIVLEHGRPFVSPAQARPKGIRKGEDRMCFMNSYHLAMQTGWTYVEGFAISDVVPIPLHHAWVIDRAGMVIETTWETAGVEYYGIPLDTSFMHKVMLETKRYGILDPYSPSFRKRYLTRLDTVIV